MRPTLLTLLQVGLGCTRSEAASAWTRLSSAERSSVLQKLRDSNCEFSGIVSRALWVADRTRFPSTYESHQEQPVHDTPSVTIDTGPNLLQDKWPTFEATVTLEAFERSSDGEAGRLARRWRVNLRGVAAHMTHFIQAILPGRIIGHMKSVKSKGGGLIIRPTLLEVQLVGFPASTASPGGAAVTPSGQEQTVAPQADQHGRQGDDRRT